MMSAIAMHVTMRQFFLCGCTHASDSTGEDECFASQWMVAIHGDFIVGDFGDGVEHVILVIVAFGASFKLHADRDICRETYCAARRARDRVRIRRMHRPVPC